MEPLAGMKQTMKKGIGYLIFEMKNEDLLIV